jgi:hypothetical protein
VKTIDECACGIARADCDYHAPPAKPIKADRARKYTHFWSKVCRNWVHMPTAAEPTWGKFLTPDGYIHTYRDGKLIDEEPATL